MSRKRRKQRKAASSEWQRLNEDVTLRTAYLELTKALEGASISAEHGGRPVDLRSAGNILAKYPQLTSYLADIHERQEADKAARGMPAELLSKASPTGNTLRDTTMLGGWSGSYDKNQPQGIPNARTLRDFAESSEWVRAAINYYCERISRADVTVLALDEKLPFNRSTEKSIKLLLDQPNEFKDTWPSLIQMMVNDKLTLGRGIWSKNMAAKRTPTALYCEDAALIKVYPAWSGNPDEPHYVFDAGNNNKVPLRDDEVIAFNYGASSYRLSLSPVQVLRNTILSDLKATESASRLVDMKPPPTMIQIPGATDSQIRNLRSVYDQDLAGRREILWLGGANPAQVKSMVFSLKDNQWMEWMEYLARKIAVIFGLSLSEFSFTGDVNKATAASQQDISENKGLIPLMLRIEEQLNRGLLADFAPRMPNGRTNINALNLRIVFPEVTEASRQMHAQRTIEMATKSLAGLPSQTINDVLLAQGLEPLPSGGNTLWIKTATGAVPWLSYDNDFGTYGNIATGGTLGSQDPDGGPNGDEVDGDMGQSDDTASTQNAPTNAAPSPSDQQGSNVTEDTSSSEKHMNAFRRSFTDLRRPGMTWQPHMLQRSASPISTKQQQSIANGHTQTDLERNITAVLRDVERRGNAVLQRHVEE